MTTFATGTGGVVCNVGGLTANKVPPDKSKQERQDVASPQGVPSVEVARKNTEQAKQQEKAAIEKEKQQQMFTTAMDKGRDADAATKKALGLKPQSHHGRKAHAAAAVAHKDAHKHFQGVSGEKGGLNHDQRAAAERKAEKHKKLAEVHQSMSEVMGGTGTVPGGKGRGEKPTKNSTGCPGVGVEINGIGAGVTSHDFDKRAASEAANHATGIAHSDTAMAERQSTTTSAGRGAQRTAAASHLIASQKHRAAAAAHGEKTDAGRYHMAMAKDHDSSAASHKNAIPHKWR